VQYPVVASWFRSRVNDHRDDKSCFVVQVNLCAKVSEAMENLYRRPEEHNSFDQNLDSLRAHGAIPVKEVLIHHND
jgi:hypothetical protein